MTNTSLSRDIQDLYLELLLANNNEADSLAAALQKLSGVVQTAQTAGATAIATRTSKLIESVNVVRQSANHQEAVPVLLDGLKSLEADFAASDSSPAPEPVASVPAPKTSNSLAEDPELLQDFVLEAREHLSVVETQLLVLEQNPADAEPTHACFRAIHTIKGIAGFLDLHDIREVSHEGETLLDNLRNGILTVTPALIDVLLKTADFLHQEVTAVEALLAGVPRKPQTDHQQLLQALRDAKNPASTNQTDTTPEPSPAPQSVAGGDASPSIPNAQASVGELQSERPVTPEANEATPSAPAPQAPAATKASTDNKKAPEAKGVSRSVKVDMEKLDYLADMVGELVVTQSMLRPENSSNSGADTPMARNLAQLARITAEVQKTTMSMRMVPVGQLFQRLARLVRDVSRQVGKAIDLELSGEDIELDRSMVEELADPLMHMIRNSIDHGIEDPEQRKKSGKNPVGRIFLQARHDAGQVQIQVSDDGRGLNRDRILQKAAQKGLVDPNAPISDSEIYNLIFEPGFSTAEKVSDLSGRGVGMDVVRRQIQKLRGRIDLRSTPGQGSTFLLRLPLTLAIIDGLVISLGANRYIVPVPAVKEILHPTEEMFFTVQGKAEMVKVRERMLPLVRLSRWLKMDSTLEPVDGVLIVLDAQGKTFCLAVDKVLGKQEVVIKTLGELLQEVVGVAGGAILGDGRVGLILDIDAIAGRPADG